MDAHATAPDRSALAEDPSGAPSPAAAGAVVRVAKTLRDAGRIIVSRARGRPQLLAANLYPTHRCNLRCTYCNSPFLRTPELTSSQWHLVIDQLADLGCRRVAILGGEPLLRTDVLDLIAHVRARDMSCVLTSNGLLVGRQIERLRTLNTLVLSLDAVGSANDRVRGDGVFAAITSAVSAAKRVGLPVKINAVLSSITAPVLDELLAFVARHDLHATINIMRSGAPDLWRDANTIKAEDGEIRETLRRVAALARTNRRILFSPITYDYAAGWGNYARDRFEVHELPADDPRVRRGPRCHAGRDYLTINPDGTVYPCSLTVGRLPGGNVIRDGVAAAWRQLHDHGCVACYSPCQVEQNYLLSLKPRVLWRFLTRHFNRFA
jgi:MoaA/NifB/PqqE/SkfB family radical SAM enzyme